MTTNASRAWGNLTTGDAIVCPGDGRAERITFARRRPDGTVHVRTSRHDHYRDQHAQATLAEEAAR